MRTSDEKLLTLYMLYCAELQPNEASSAKLNFSQQNISTNGRKQSLSLLSAQSSPNCVLPGYEFQLKSNYYVKL